MYIFSEFRTIFSYFKHFYNMNDKKNNKFLIVIKIK